MEIMLSLIFFSPSNLNDTKMSFNDMKMSKKYPEFSINEMLELYCSMRKQSLKAITFYVNKGKSTAAIE